MRDCSRYSRVSYVDCRASQTARINRLDSRRSRAVGTPRTFTKPEIAMIIVASVTMIVNHVPRFCGPSGFVVGSPKCSPASPLWLCPEELICFPGSGGPSCRNNFPGLTCVALAQ